MENQDIDYVVDKTTPKNKTLERYKEQYDTMLGNDLFSNGNFIEANLRDFIQYTDITSEPPTNATPIHQQSFSLYVLAICTLDRVAEDKKDDKFYTGIYFPLLYTALSKFLHTLRRFLANQDSIIYNGIEEKAADIIGFSLAVYNLSANIIKSDTQKIFLKTFFIETSPFNLQDIHSYYYLQLQYIYYEYIKNKTKGLVPIEDLLELQQANRVTSYNRVSIYEQGIRNHRIKLMCLNSDTLKEVERNYDRLKGRILSNKFVLLFKQSTGIEIHDNKIALLYLNSTNLNILEKEYPLVCRLLRSIRVKSDVELFSDAEKLEIRDIVFTSAFNKLKSNLGNKTANKLASHLAQSITSDLVSGEYIDPRTMSHVMINTKIFASQFQRFLSNVLESLKV